MNAESRQKSFILWFTGLSCSGKTTIGNEVAGYLKERGVNMVHLDGDELRKTLSRDLGFSKEDRDEHIRRAGSLAKFLQGQGFCVVASFISPYRTQREGVRKEVENFIEIFCNCPLAVCRERDTKGLYKKAERGEISLFTGVSDPYEVPEHAELELFTAKDSVEQNVKKVIAYLEQDGFLQ